MDKNELNDWIEKRLAHLDANACEPNTDRAFTRLRSRILGGRSFTSDINAATTLRASAQREKIDQNGRATLQPRRKCSVMSGALAPEATFLPPFRNLLHGGVGRKFWLIGAALAAAACLCLLAFPTSRDAVQRLFVRGSNSKLVYVGQVYADLKTMKDKQPEIDFTLKDAEGRNVTLSDLKGKVVLLNFWATWCEGCKTEIPWLIEFEQKYREKGLAVIGVAEDADGWKSAGPYVKKTGLNYTVVSDDDGSIANRYGLFGMPVTYLIDRDGKVSAASVGIVNKSECEAEILRLLGN